MRHLRACFAALVAVWLIALDAPLGAQGAADLFSDGVIHDVRVFINSRDLAQMRAAYTENTFYPADLEWRGQRVRNVGIRVRGTGTRSQTKPGLLVETDRYTTNQRFLGLRSIVLDNLLQEPSMMNEQLAMAVFRRMGQPAPRESYARVYINNELHGLYSIIEGIDFEFLGQALGHKDGYLFEYHYVDPFFMGYPGDDWDAYRRRFEAQTPHRKEADATLYGPIRDLFREINAADDAVWRGRMDELIDLRQFMTLVAIQGCVAENDGVHGYSGINNFYIHRPAGSSKHTLIPWDMDNSFAFVGASVLRDSDLGDVVLFARAWDQPDLRDVFLTAAASCAELMAGDNWLLAEIDRRAELITGVVFGDRHKPFTNDEYLEAVEFLRRFAAENPAAVLRDVGALRRSADRVSVRVTFAPSH